MFENLYLIGVVACMLFTAALCYGLAFFWVVHVRPRWFTRLDFKPFNCRPCMTFWLTILAQLGFALAARSALIVAFGEPALLMTSIFATLIAFLNFFIVLYIENRSIYE